MYTEEDYCKSCGKIYTSRFAIYNELTDEDNELDSKYNPFCSSRCKKQFYSEQVPYYRNGVFLSERWNGDGENYIIGKGYMVLHSKGGNKYERKKDGNWYKIAG